MSSKDISTFSSGGHFVHPKGTSREPYRGHFSKMIFYKDFSILSSDGHLVLQRRIFR